MTHASLSTAAILESLGLQHKPNITTEAELK